MEKYLLHKEMSQQEMDAITADVAKEEAISSAKVPPEADIYDLYGAEGVFIEQVDTSRPSVEITETRVARVAAVKGTNTQIIALEGLDMSLDNLPKGYTDLRGEAYTFESNAPVDESFYRHYYDKLIWEGSFNPKQTIEGSDKKHLWDVLEQTVNSVEAISELGVLDIKNLTPYQASMLVYKTLEQNMQYDYDAVEGAKGDWIARGNVLDKQTSEKFLKGVDSGEKSKGICRHMAAVASDLYEVLKQKQDGVLMNGTYMLYYTPTKERVESNTITEIEKHAYNVLVVAGDSYENTPKNLSVTVLDPTFAIDGGAVAYDRTLDRLTTAVRFVREFGDSFIDNAADEADALYDEVLSRIDDVPRNVNSFNDYLALLSLKDKSPEHLVQSVHDLAKDNASLVDSFNLFNESKQTAYRTKIIRSEFLTPLYNHFSDIDLSAKDRATEAAFRNILLCAAEHADHSLPVFNLTLKACVARADCPSAAGLHRLYLHRKSDASSIDNITSPQLADFEKLVKDSLANYPEITAKDDLIHFVELQRFANSEESLKDEAKTVVQNVLNHTASTLDKVAVFNMLHSSGKFNSQETSLTQFVQDGKFRYEVMEPPYLDAFLDHLTQQDLDSADNTEAMLAKSFLHNDFRSLVDISDENALLSDLKDTYISKLTNFVLKDFVDVVEVKDADALDKMKHIVDLYKRNPDEVPLDASLVADFDRIVVQQV